jgi:hypothetical protein
MAADPITVVILGVPAAALALKTIVDFADTVEKTTRYWAITKKALNRAFIRTKIYSRRKTSRFFNFFWFFLTGHAILGPDEDPPPRPPGGGRKMRPGPIAFVGFGTRFAEPKVVCASATASSPSSSA